MLDRTFCHVEGISILSENQLWKEGIYSWDDFLEKRHKINCLSETKKQKIAQEIFFSKDYLEKNNLDYFAKRLPPKELWRLYGHGKVAFVDIETTGLSRYTDDITLIGIYDSENAKIFIKGQDLEQAYEELEKYDIFVTFNGKQFDLPFIEHKASKKYEKVHLDLRFLLSEFGLRGGLKKIEKELGLQRDEEVCNVDGYEAVKLWWRYCKGDEEALRLLLKYNREDIVNLKTLLEWYIGKKEEYCKELQEHSPISFPNHPTIMYSSKSGEYSKYL
ncbi:ribonuclease H-like domain-containing protein [Candidatus Woesearchaeota archaeon]|nr:ribonuclease H-like domain-containing protein [Nanoarchaeota archaeon]MCB9370959.1 ribonuclease H-like domain-containing protein [Candidatus Woesearchaeota archaeon]USN44061.1 MAG: ribonuclease H-like domain-containing protein [Candidatus Woesearchaeota archaeon]